MLEKFMRFLIREIGLLQDGNEPGEHPALEGRYGGATANYEVQHTVYGVRSTYVHSASAVDVSMS
jgi:hypothetical protein